jgi:hypothetical protein
MAWIDINRLGEPSIELPVPLDVAAETDGQPSHDHLEASADSVAGLLGRIDDRLHPLLDVLADAVQFRVGRNSQHILEGDRQRIADGRRPDGRDVADDRDAEFLEELASDGADRDARRRFASAGALEHVAECRCGRT